MKNPADKFTIDAFETPRRGRPPKLNAKSNAQRQREFRARQKLDVLQVEKVKPTVFETWWAEYERKRLQGIP